MMDIIPEQVHFNDNEEDQRELSPSFIESEQIEQVIDGNVKEPWIRIFIEPDFTMQKEDEHIIACNEADSMSDK